MNTENLKLKNRIIIADLLLGEKAYFTRFNK